MERRLKERLTGAVVLLLLAIIFIPMILDNSAQEEIKITDTNIPPAPEMEFKSAIVPIEPIPAVEIPAMPVAESSSDTPAQSPIAAEALITESMPVTTSATAATPPETGVQDGNVLPTQTDTTQAQTADTAPRSMSAWVIQLGSFSSQDNADSLVRKLQGQGFPGYIEQVKTDTGIVYKVRVGPELSRTDAESIQRNLKSKMNIDAIIMRFP